MKTFNCPVNVSSRVATLAGTGTGVITRLLNETLLRLLPVIGWAHRNVEPSDQGLARFAGASQQDLVSAAFVSAAVAVLALLERARDDRDD